MLSVADAKLLIGHLLKLADVIAVIDQRVGRRRFCDVDRTDPYTMLRRQLGDRWYLCEMLQRYTGKHTLSFACIVEVMASVPLQ